MKSIKKEHFLEINDKRIIDIKIANTFFKRTKGLMGQKNIDYGLFFFGCNNIHTFFMKEPIDVIYTNSENVIIHMDKEMKPYKLGKILFKAKNTLELPYGTIDKSNISIGDKIFILS